jgi:hypothetical protein
MFAGIDKCPLEGKATSVKENFHLLNLFSRSSILSFPLFPVVFSLCEAAK